MGALIWMTKTMRSIHPPLSTRRLFRQCEQSQRPMTQRWLSTVLTLHFFAQKSLIQYNSPRTIHRFIQKKRWGDLMWFSEATYVQLLCYTRKKSALLNEAQASCLCNVDLGVTPTSFSLATTDHHKLSWYVLKDALGCPVGCCLLIHICTCANGNPTKVLYSDQAKHISKIRKQHNLNTKCWRMAGAHFYVMQGRIVQTTLHNKLQSNFLSQSCFNRSGAIGRCSMAVIQLCLFLGMILSTILTSYVLWQAIWPILSMGASLQIQN